MVHSLWYKKVTLTALGVDDCAVEKQATAVNIRASRHYPLRFVEVADDALRWAHDETPMAFGRQ